MRLHVMSDVHFEFHSNTDTTLGPSFTEHFWLKLESLRRTSPSPILVLAGDICQINNGYNEARFGDVMERFCSMYEKVVYVPGNHEYYHSNFQAVDRGIADVAARLPNLVNLQVAPFEHDQVVFFGGTMWYPRPLPWMPLQRISDHRLIWGFEPDVYDRHASFVESLVSLPPKDKRYVVVTHHMPHPKSIPPEFQNSASNPFFMVDMTANLQALLSRGIAPVAWIHGHSHGPADYKLDATRVYANPFGYPQEGANPKFWDRIAVDIEIE